MEKENILLYHANCPDGFSSAYSFWKKYGDSMDYISVTHGDPPPDNLAGKNVYIADFSYSKKTLLHINNIAKKLVVIDHHISAERELGDLEFCKFDISHSGGYLSWSYNFPNKKVPEIIKYIEDRDLWLWKMPHSEEILSAIDSYDKTFECWEELDSMIRTKEGFDRLLNEGIAILRYKNKLIDIILETSHELEIAGKIVPATNTPFFQSEIASLTSKDGYAAAYFFNGEDFIFSLRSSSEDNDVSMIAKMFGGGGHKMSSGFSVKDLGSIGGV